MNPLFTLRSSASRTTLPRAIFALSLGVCGLCVTMRTAQAQSSLSSLADVGINNGFYNDTFAQQEVFDNSTAFASIPLSFTGLDGAGNTQTMNFTGTAITQANYGSLHSYTAGTLVNSYYNASNPAYADNNGNTINTAGSPKDLYALGFAWFNDTLQYGGDLQAGYKARYIFHVDGTNSGVGAAADLSVNVDGLAGDSFFDFDSGSFAADWVTRDYDINGITPQTIQVQFSDQVVFDTSTLTDGQDYSGISDFSSTATLAGIQVVDALGNPVSGWTVTAASGTIYPQAVNTPEPGVTALLLSLGIPVSLLARRRRRHR